MNRALTWAVREHQDSGAFEPGDLDRALRDGRVTLTISLQPTAGETKFPNRTH